MFSNKINKSGLPSWAAGLLLCLYPLPQAPCGHLSLPHGPFIVWLVFQRALALLLFSLENEPEATPSMFWTEKSMGLNSKVITWKAETFGSKSSGKAMQGSDQRNTGLGARLSGPHSGSVTSKWHRVGNSPRNSPLWASGSPDVPTS